MEEKAIHISLSAERLFDWVFPVTNSLLASWFAILLLLVFAIVFRRSLKEVPGRIQSLVEALFDYSLSYMEEVLEDKRLARKIFPFVMTIFLFVLFSNWIIHLPFFSALKFYGNEGATYLLRPANTDLNVTLALAAISFVLIEVVGVLSIGIWKYAGKFINFSSPLNFAIGLIELISELARLVAFSFRLFGNVFAGKVMIVVLAFFVPYILPVPIMAFEIFVGFVQAAIFALLTLFFIKLAIMEPEHAH